MGRLQSNSWLREEAKPVCRRTLFAAIDGLHTPVRVIRM